MYVEAQNNSQAVLWCRYANDDYDPMSITVDLPFDPSQEWHNYVLLFSSTPIDAEQVTVLLTLDIRLLKSSN